MGGKKLGSIDKIVEYELFKGLIKKVYQEKNPVLAATSWARIGRELGVSERTVTLWKTRPEIQEIIRKAQEFTLTQMMETGQDDWKMWKSTGQMLDIDFKDKPNINVDNSNKNININIVNFSTKEDKKEVIED